METIELEPLDKKDLLELLDYAKEKKLEDDLKVESHFKMGRYWTERINQLKMIIKGYQVRGGIQSSYETIDYEMNQKEKEHLRYKNRLENDVEDMLDVVEEWKFDNDTY